MLRETPECGGASTLPSFGRRCVQEDAMQGHIRVGLGALLGLLICSGAEAAPRDARDGVGRNGPGADPARVSSVARGYAAPEVRGLGPVRRGELARGTHGDQRADAARTAGAWDNGVARTYSYRSVGAGWSGAGGYGRMGGRHATAPDPGYAPNYGYAAQPGQPGRTYLSPPRWGDVGGPSSGYVAAPAQAYVAVPYATGPQYGAGPNYG